MGAASAFRAGAGAALCSAEAAAEAAGADVSSAAGAGASVFSAAGAGASRFREPDTSGYAGFAGEVAFFPAGEALPDPASLPPVTEEAVAAGEAETSVFAAAGTAGTEAGDAAPEAAPADAAAEEAPEETAADAALSAGADAVFSAEGAGVSVPGACTAAASRC